MFGEEPAYKNRQHDICQARSEMSEVNKVIDLNEVRVTPRDQQALKSLVRGCGNKEIAGQSKISPRTVKQPWCRLFPPHRYLGMAASESNPPRRIYTRAGQILMLRERLTPGEVQVATLVWHI
jgi:Bacterial regulatory proteins, luxR family